MPQSLSNMLVHLVFSTKNRSPWLTAEVRSELYRYLAGTLRSLDAPSLEIGGTADHVHIVFRLPRTLTAAQIVQSVKTESSKWAKGPAGADFAWQAGYGAFSVGHREVQMITKYVQNQECHHRQVSFQDEYRQLLAEAGIAFDEKYMWD